MKNNFSIRLAEKKDAEGILDIYRPFVENTAISFETAIPSVGEMENRVVQTMPNYPWLVCLDGNMVAAFAYAGAHRKREAYQWTTEVSVYVHPKYRGRKLATALYISLFEILKWQGFVNALAGIVLPNPASVDFHRALGFRPFARYEKVGFKLGNWQTTEWWRFDLKPKFETPLPLKPLGAMQNTAAWEEAVDKGIGMIQSV